MSAVTATRRVARGVGKTIKWMLIGSFLLIVIIAIVAIASAGKAVNKSEQNGKATAAKIGQVHNGMTEAAVRSILGTPESTQRSNVQGLGYEDEWYYGTLSKNDYQLSFNNGRLNSINRY
jgi:outer membrane protein assembly factor BamE (lipoprotein component of BamABCDE complex)